MFVILSSNLLSIIEDTLKVQCLSKCKMHCLLWRKYLDENEKSWACAEKHTHIYGHRHRHVHYNVHDQLHSQRDAPDRGNS